MSDRLFLIIKQLPHAPMIGSHRVSRQLLG